MRSQKPKKRSKGVTQTNLFRRLRKKFMAKTTHKRKILRALRRASELSPVVAKIRDAIANCGKPAVATMVGGYIGESYILKGRWHCGLDLCSFCAIRLAARDEKNVSLAISTFLSLCQDHGIMTYALTLSRSTSLGYRHHEVLGWYESQLLFEESMALFSQKYFPAVRKRLEIFSYFRKTERQYNPGSWIDNQVQYAGVNQHAHCIAMIGNRFVEELGDLFWAKLIFDAWEKAVRAATRKLRKERRAKLDWIDLDQDHILEPPYLKENEDGEIETKGAVNVCFVSDIDKAVKYANKVSQEVSFSNIKNGKNSYSGFALPALIDVPHLRTFALKAYEYHVLATKMKRDAEFGRVRVDGINQSPLTFFASYGLCGNHKRPDFVPKHAVERKEFTDTLGSRAGETEVSKALDNANMGRKISKKSKIFRAISEDEGSDLLDAMDEFNARRLAKNLVEKRGVVTGTFVLNWYFNGDSYAQRKAMDHPYYRLLQLSYRKGRAPVDFKTEFAKLAPTKK